MNFLFMVLQFVKLTALHLSINNVILLNNLHLVNNYRLVFMIRNETKRKYYILSMRICNILNSHNHHYS